MRPIKHETDVRQLVEDPAFRPNFFSFWLKQPGRVEALREADPLKRLLLENVRLVGASAMYASVLFIYGKQMLTSFFHRTSWLQTRPTTNVEAPWFGEFLLFVFLPKEDREIIPADLLEEMNEVLVPKFGSGAARVWYWAQVVRSIWPMVGRRLVKVVSWGAIAKAVGFLVKRFVA